MSPRKTKTILFDCDNTLVQSESLASEVSADITNEILAAHGVNDVHFDGPQLEQDFVGTTFQLMMRNILEAYNLRDKVQLSDAQLTAYGNEEDTRFMAKIKQAGRLLPCDGVSGVLSQLLASFQYKLAVVSSSAMPRIQASLEATSLAGFFLTDDIFSVASSLPSPLSKPDPAIYLHALQQLGADASETVAIEDSPSGALSAVRAGIRVIGYTGGYRLEDREKQRAKLQAVGCFVVMDDWAEFEGCLSAV